VGAGEFVALLDSPEYSNVVSTSGSSPGVIEIVREQLGGYVRSVAFDRSQDPRTYSSNSNSIICRALGYPDTYLDVTYLKPTQLIEPRLIVPPMTAIQKAPWGNYLQSQSTDQEDVEVTNESLCPPQGQTENNTGTSK